MPVVTEFHPGIPRRPAAVQRRIVRADGPAAARAWHWGGRHSGLLPRPSIGNRHQAQRALALAGIPLSNGRFGNLAGRSTTKSAGPSDDWDNATRR